MRKACIALMGLLLIGQPLALAKQNSATQGLSITVTQHSVSLSWTATSSSGITGYNVYRSLTSGSGYSNIGSTNSATTTYTDQTVIAGTRYFYVVTAFSPACPASPTCGESSNSNEVNGTIPTP